MGKVVVVHHTDNDGFVERVQFVPGDNVPDLQPGPHPSPRHRQGRNPSLREQSTTRRYSWGGTLAAAATSPSAISRTARNW